MSYLVSIQQAAANAYAAWLQTQLPDVVIEPRWPSPEKEKPAKSITLVMAGRRRDTPIEPRVIGKTAIGATETRAAWQVAACTQPFQLDVWALSDVERDDILARLDMAFYSGEASLGDASIRNPAGVGNLVELQDGWQEFDTVADFIFEEPAVEDTSDSHGRNLYRASYRGDAHFMLTVTATTARLAIARFTIRLSETDSSTYST